MKKYFKIGEISKLYNIGVDSLRYYEETGLIFPQRSDSKYRLYSIDDIWRLNVIRELRELGFSMKKIKSYLDDHTLSSTMELLKEEQQLVNNKLSALNQLKVNVEKRMENIEKAKNIPLDTISLKHIDERKCFSLSYEYTDEYEMDVLIKKLGNIDKEHFYIIGNNKIGSAVNVNDFIKTNKLCYNSVFIINDSGNKIIPSGDYLSICYSGKYVKSKENIKKLISYAEKHNYTLSDNFFEILWTDIHSTLKNEEHITEIQVEIIT